MAQTVHHVSKLMPFVPRRAVLHCHLRVPPTRLSARNPSTFHCLQFRSKTPPSPSPASAVPSLRRQYDSWTWIEHMYRSKCPCFVRFVWKIDGQMTSYTSKLSDCRPVGRGWAHFECFKSKSPSLGCLSPLYFDTIEVLTVSKADIFLLCTLKFTIAEMARKTCSEKDCGCMWFYYSKTQIRSHCICLLAIR